MIFGKNIQKALEWPFNFEIYRFKVGSFLPARRYASAGYRDRNVSVCPSVRHAPVLCQNKES